MKLERTIGRRATRGCLEMSISWNQADSHISSATTKFSPPCCTLTTMQAIQILTTGSADVLTLRDPPTPGQEAAGIVESVAADVTDVKPGDRVAWCGIPGTYARFAIAPAARLVPIPEGVSFNDAAAALT